MASAGAGAGAGEAREIVVERECGSRTIRCAVPKNCLKSVPVKLGIDEAGRGPVLGSMVYGAAYWPISEDEELGAMDFDDSKALTAEKRESMFKALKDTNRIGWIVDVISPADISAKMQRRTPYSLNKISFDAAIGMIRQVLADGVNVVEVFVDTVGPPEKYQAFLTKTFENKIVFTVAKKADSLYPVVSAASICAKVTRDEELVNWKFEEPGFEPVGVFGSGYPGDAKTKAFLQNNMHPVFGFPSVVRFSWSTADKILDAKGTPVEWPEEEDDDQASTMKLSAMFSAGPRRPKFFKDARLDQAMEF